MLDRGRCGAEVSTACQGTRPLRKTCKKCDFLDNSMETDYYPKTLKEAVSDKIGG